MAIPPLLLRKIEGPADLFCAAATWHASGPCKAGLRPDGTCPDQARHHRGWDPIRKVRTYLPHVEYTPHRMDAPELIWQDPLCPLCEQPVHHDGDGFVCDPCRFSWGNHGEPGSAHDTGDRQCDAVTEDGRYRCVLVDGHQRRQDMGIRTRRLDLSTPGLPFVEYRDDQHCGIRVEPDGYPDPHGYWFEDVHRWPAGHRTRPRRVDPVPVVVKSGRL